jgi:hypothetical protein
MMFGSVARGSGVFRAPILSSRESSMRRVRLLVPAVAFILILAIVVGIGGRGV